MLTVASPVHFENKPIVIVMGVSGSGKSTVGKALAKRFDLPFLDADDYHSNSNVEKMSQGIALSDEDRWPWLAELSQAMLVEGDKFGGSVATCSALKRRYRDFIVSSINKPLVFIFLDGKRDTLLLRMQQRKSHYMPPSLLDSQLADLERPDTSESALTFFVETPLDTLVNDIAFTLTAKA